MSIYESSWGHGWDAEVDDFEGLGCPEPELNVIEYLDSLDDVERLTSATLHGRKNRPSLHRDSSFEQQQQQYSFNAAVYALTIKCLETGTRPTDKQLKKADPLFPEKKRSNRAFPNAAVTRWKSFCTSLTVVEFEVDGVTRKGLTFKWDKFNRIIAYHEDWPSIVDRFHVDPETGRCLSSRETIHATGQRYVTGGRRHGIPEEYIKSRVSECEKCEERDDDAEPGNYKRPRKAAAERWPEEHSVPWQQLDEFIEGLCIRHKVSLRKESTYRIASPEPCIVTTWVCARGYRRQESPACAYRVRTVIPVRIANLPELNPGFADAVVESTPSDRPELAQMMVDSVQLPDFRELSGHESFFEQSHHPYVDSSSFLVTVLLNRSHRGHNPNDKEDYVNFPVHPTAKEAVLYEFDLSWDTIAVSRASLRMDMLLKSRATDIEKATSRFHLLPKEVAQLTIELNSQGKLATGDWSRLLKEVEAHKKKGTIIFLQQYDVFNPVEEKQPFVCVIMTPWMREMAERFSGGNVWALDSTFKTCVRGLPLYAAAVPNQDGIGMPVFFMLCSADTGSRHESIALRLAFAAVFKQLSVRPAAILMDKSRLTYDALSDVISRDEKCWKDGKLLACRPLLCWFCVKKAWVENLLPQVAPENRRDVYRRLDGMMMAASETDFNNGWNIFKEHYGARKEIMDYLEMGWAGAHCAWRPTWPTYGRLFEHGTIETVNIVRHFWLFLKYSVFQGRVNRSNSDLLVALIGSAVTDTKPHGGTLEDFYRQRQSLCDSRRYQSQASTSAERKRLAAADRYLAKYNEDRSCFEVLSEPGFLFRLHNCGGDPSRTHIVNLLTNFCDCLEMKFTCEHLLAARLVLKHSFIGMYGLLERRTREGDEPVTQVEDIDLAWLDEREGSDERAMGLGSTETSASSAYTEWDSLVQEVAHVQMQLSNLQTCCEDQLIVSPAVEELSTLLATQLKSLRGFTGGSSSSDQDVGGNNSSSSSLNRVGIIQEHLKACKLQAVKCSVQVKGPSSSAASCSSKQASYAHAQTVVHPKLGYVHYYKQLKPAKVSRRKCVFCGVYNVVGGAFEVTECKNCSRYLFYEILPK